MFGRTKPCLNDDHDPADYRVCSYLHPLRRVVFPGATSTVIGYVCDVCAANDEPCLVFPHSERMKDFEPARSEEAKTTVWVVIARLTFGLIDPYDLYRVRDDES